MIGTDSDDPRLPAAVVAATQGTTADDLASGIAGGFVGAFATANAPLASTVNPGHFYWDTTRAQPYWSDGEVWRTVGASTSPGGGGEGDPENPPDVEALEVTFTLTPSATTFQPWITLKAGATGTIEWRNSAGTLLATGGQPTITAPADKIVVMSVVSGVALVMSAIEVINLGFDRADYGPETPPTTHLWPAQPVLGISSLTGLTSLKYFMASNTQLTGALNCTNLFSLISIEAFNARLTDIAFEGTSLNRLCLERCHMTNVDLTPIAATIRDLRCAVQGGGPVTLHTDEILPHLWHYCTRDQVVTTHIDQADMPALEECWAWNTGMTTWDVPISPVIRSINLHHNVYTSATLDAWLIAVAAGSTYNGSFNMLEALSPTDASAAARATLEARGWVLTIPTPAPGGGGWTYAAPTHNDFVSGDLTNVNVTPSVVSGDLTFNNNSYGMMLLRPASRTAGDVFFEVAVDRGEINGSAGTDYFVLVTNCSSTGTGGLGARIRFPQVLGTSAAGISFGPSSSSGFTAGTPIRINPDPAGWATAGTHKIGLLHQGASATIIFDGVKVYQCNTTEIDGYAGGGYIGVAGDSDLTTRVIQTWGYTEV